MALLGEFVNIKTGKLDANAAVEGGKYPFFTCSRTNLEIDNYAFDADAILVAGNGDLNVKHYKGKFNAYQRTYVITIKKTDLLDSRYLYHWMSKYVDRLRELSIGGVIKYIKLGMLTDAEIPLPPLEEQKRISAILDKADAIRRKRQQAIDLTDQLLRSVFLDMFGDPVTNPKGWDVSPLGTLVKALEGGKNVKPDESGQPTVNRVLKVSAVTYGVYRADESKPLPDEFVPPESYYVKAGDLLISRANTVELIGATAYVYETPDNVVLPDKIWRFVWKDIENVHPLYIHYLFKQPSIRREVSIRSSGTSGSMKNIPKPKLLEIHVPIPPVAVQNKFGEVVHKLQETYKDYSEHSNVMNNLFSAISQSAFRGELSKKTKAA